MSQDRDTFIIQEAVEEAVEEAVVEAVAGAVAGAVVEGDSKKASPLKS